MFSQASKGLRCKALENAVRLLYHKAVRKAQRLPWSETALTVSEWFNVLSGVQRLALQGFGERREVIIPQKQANDVCGGTTVPRPAATGPFDGTMFSVPESDSFR